MPSAAWYSSFCACQRIKQAAAGHQSVVPLMQLEKSAFYAAARIHSTDVDMESFCCSFHYSTGVSECMVQGSALYTDGIDGRPDHSRGPRRVLEAARRTSRLVAVATPVLNA